ncbi:uncharacterized protein T26G10.4-like [Carettochelys insculpta]|uniref:uncharacterized protein T26G10.4-like n=1 Tax=Carettochelys insculpta TaxID=44489 RepID=UPI003EBED490
MFSVQGQPMIPLEEGQFYQHLGTPTGVQIQGTPEDTIFGILKDAERLDDSLLAPWQKIDALNTFLIPRINFTLRGSAVTKVPLNKADKTIRHLVQKWMYLPTRAATDIIYISNRQGGANIPRMGDLCDVASITHAFRLLTCLDPRVRTVAENALRDTTRRRIGRAPTAQDLVTYLSGSLEGEFGRDGGDLSSFWSRARNASRRLGKRIGCRWVWSEERRELGILIPRIATEGHTIVTPSTRTLLERLLKNTIRHQYAEALRKKPDQGKVFDVTSCWGACNHFLRAGNFTRFADWRFIHRACLNCVPLNGAVCHGICDKRCRRCGYPLETLPHVLCGCMVHSAAWQCRHNAIQDRLVKALPPTLGSVTVDSSIPGTDSLLRPDIVMTNEWSKKVLIVDITVPFENRMVAFCDAQAKKLQKYAPLADTLRSRGYLVEVHALLVGALGVWDPLNDVLEACEVSRYYARMMRRLMVSDAIRWSRDIYIEHITGHRQYSDR